MEISATCILPGKCCGQLLSTRHPISFWGCVDPATGNISDKRHPLFGASVAGKVLVFPYGKGSSTGSLMILELLRVGLAPAAIVNIRTEPLLATGPVVGKLVYGKTFPIVNVNEADFDHLQTGLFAQIESLKSGATIRIADSPVR
jgi:predicted aconitase with swiveling domain